MDVTIRRKKLNTFSIDGGHARALDSALFVHWNEHKSSSNFSAVIWVNWNDGESSYSKHPKFRPCNRWCFTEYQPLVCCYQDDPWSNGTNETWNVNTTAHWNGFVQLKTVNYTFPPFSLTCSNIFKRINRKIRWSLYRSDVISEFQSIPWRIPIKTVHSFFILICNWIQWQAHSGF